MIGLVPFLTTCGVKFTPEQTKVHLACWNGREHPIDEYYAGTFNSWQEHQTRRNFNCESVLSLIDLGNKTWMFAGVYEVLGDKPHPKVEGDTLYSLRLRPKQADLIGRIIVQHTRTRQSYIWCKTAGELPILEIRREPMTIADFPGYNSVAISHQTLTTIVKQKLSSWHGALANIKGVYLITDLSNGKHYVGKASGSVGIWQRWRQYVETGHGGNAELRKVLKSRGPEHARHFQYSILEIADSHASDADILAREGHWMNVLQTRKFGLN